MQSFPNDPHFLKEFFEEDRGLKRRRSNVAFVLILIFIPLGSIMDYFIYPDKFESFVIIRTIVEVFTVVCLILNITAIGVRHSVTLVLLISYISLTAFCVMIYFTEGAYSPYYAGIILYFVGSTVLLPWSALQTMGMWVPALLLYVISCMLFENKIGEYNLGVLFANSFFLLTTGVIASTASHFTSQARVRDFILRKELDLRNRELEKLDELKSQFFANVSHELRTPLTLILTPIREELLKRAELHPALHDSLKTIERNALRLLKLINELLDLVKLEQGQRKLSLETVDLSVFLPGLVDSLRYTAERKKITINYKDCGYSLFVSLDPAGIEKVILNLLTNAIKFTPVNGQINFRWTMKNKNVVLEIEDTGIGIPFSELDNIFKRFYQVPHSSSRQTRGVGVGLALAREIVHFHGGTLKVESIEGEGSTFRISLPLNPTGGQDQTSNKTDVVEEDPFEKSSRAANRYFGSLDESTQLALKPVGSGSQEIFVVDDEHDMLRYLTNILSRDYRVHPISTGEEVLSRAIESHPNLIILDWMLPGLSGLETCKAIRKWDPDHNIKILILTARIDEDSKIKALSYGSDDFLTKPFSSTELLTRVKNLLINAELQHNLHTKNQDLEQTLKQLKETESILVQSEKMNALGNLSAGLLHEINNPLNVAIAAVAYANDIIPDDSPEMQETLQDVKICMDRINKIVSDLHTFAHPVKDYENTPFNMGEAVESALSLGAHALDQIKIVKNLNGSLRPLGSKQQIVHVILNFLLNAAVSIEKKDSKNKGLIEIVSRTEDDRVYLSVRDNGKGIPPDLLDKIFDPFFTTSQVGESMGLGLSITHTIVKNHGGRINVNSKTGEGAEFSFDLTAESPKRGQ